MPVNHEKKYKDSIAISEYLEQKFPVLDIGGVKIEIINHRCFPGHVTRPTIKSHQHHDTAELSFVLHGIGIYKTLKETHNFKPGSFMFSPPDKIHDWECLQKNPIFHDWRFKVNISNSERNKSNIFWEFIISKPGVYETPKSYYTNYNIITDQYFTKSFLREQIIKNCYTNILIDIAREIAQKNNSRIDLLSPKEISFIKSVESYLFDNLAKDIDKNELENLLDIPIETIEKKYLSNTGVTLEAQKRKLRLYKAEEFIVKEQIRQIKSIAIEVGYYDFSYFTKLFKKEFGITPTEYRKLLRAAAPDYL